MSCTTNQNKLEPVSIANGILPLANRMAGTLTSWNMWMDVKSPGDVVDKASSVLTGMTGVANPAGALYLGSDLLFWLRDRKNSQAEASPPEPELTPEQLDRMTRKKERIETVKQLFNVDDQEAERLADQYNPNKKEDDKAEMRETAEKQKERIKAIKQTLNIKSTEEAEALASKYGPPPKKEKPKPEPRSARYPKIVSPVGAMIALHTFEAATGTAGTAATRLFLPGKPVGTWRNVVVREDRLMPLKTKALNRLTGGRVIDSAGYYFQEGGRTWMCESYTVNLKGTARTMTRAYTLAVPKREHFFDRPLTLGSSQNNGTDPVLIGDDAQKRELPIQRIIDVVKGVNQPEQVPGYIGSTNELSNITVLGKAQRALYAASWFLLDESERDTGGGIGYADYHATMFGNNNNSSTNVYRRVDSKGNKVTRSSSSIADYTDVPLLRIDPRTGRVSTTSGTGDQMQVIAKANALPVNTTSDTDDTLYYFGRKVTYAELSHPNGPIKKFIEDDNGMTRPMLLRNMLTQLDGSLIPDAIYCDGDKWNQVADPVTLGHIAQDYRGGGIKKTLHWRAFTRDYECPPPLLS